VPGVRAARFRGLIDGGAACREFQDVGFAGGERDQAEHSESERADRRGDDEAGSSQPCLVAGGGVQDLGQG
jgi:hypothetical protein